MMLQLNRSVQLALWMEEKEHQSKLIVTCNLKKYSLEHHMNRAELGWVLTPSSILPTDTTGESAAWLQINEQSVELYEQ